MDGTNPLVIIEKDLGWPNAIAVAYDTQELFFGDVLSTGPWTWWSTLPSDSPVWTSIPATASVC